MNNFFYNNFDYTLFKKAFKETKGEPVIINILSSDSSLTDKKKETKQVARKNYSNKFEPSPFGKFFGPRRQQTSSVDMNNFSSWKNKNYRDIEKKIDKTEKNPLKFSIADFMNERSKSMKYNELDQAKSEVQKPITQLSSSDPLYKRFSLDSYMHKLEEQTKVKSSFEQNDDILEPLGDLTEKVVPDSSQDENFSYASDVNVEGVAFDDNIGGEKYRIAQDELDKVKSRLEKMEREIKDKSNEKVLSSEISDLTKDDNNDSFDLEKLGFDDEDIDDDNKIEVDDIEKVNDKVLSKDETSLKQADENKPKVDHKKFMEINRTESSSPRKNNSDAKSDENELNKNVNDDIETSVDVDENTEEAQEVDADKQTEAPSEDLNEESVNLSSDEEPEENNDNSGIDGDENENDLVDAEQSSDDEFKTEIYDNDKRVDRDDILTKQDFRTMTDEFMQRFAQLYKKDDDNQNIAQQYDQQGNINSEVSEQYSEPEPYVAEQYTPFVQTAEQVNQNNELQSKILELIEQNKKADSEAEEKLKKAELEKEKVAEEYENKIKEIEENYKKSYEEFKQKAYLEKLDSDLKLQQAESDFKKRESKIKEKEKAISKKQKMGELLKKEIKSNVSISNLEMEKKLLEESAKKGKKVETKVITKERIVEVPVKKKPVKKRGPKKKRRKIDSDIIGNIDFE